MQSLRSCLFTHAHSFTCIAPIFNHKLPYFLFSLSSFVSSAKFPAGFWALLCLPAGAKGLEAEKCLPLSKAWPWPAEGLPEGPIPSKALLEGLIAFKDLLEGWVKDAGSSSRRSLNVHKKLLRFECYKQHELYRHRTTKFQIRGALQA